MKIARCIVDGLLPHGCTLCGHRLVAPGICEPCKAELPWIAAACPICATPRPAGTAAVIPCGACQRNRPPFVEAVAPLHYRFPVDAMIKALKFRGHGWVAPALAGLVLPAVAGCTADAIVPVPLHRWRHARRGFNQAAELAGPLARHLGLPIRRLLTRRRATRPQSGLDAVARRKNLRDAFVVVRGELPASVLLVDDVITTGETACAAAVALRTAGVKTVKLAAVARSS